MEEFIDNCARLRAACASGDVEVVNELLSGRNKVWIDSKDQKGRSSLQIAVDAGNEVIIEMLLDYNGKWCKKYRLGNTNSIDQLILSAAKNGNLSLVTLLVKRGFDVNFALATDHKTPLWYAVEKGHAEVVHFLLRKLAELRISSLSWDAMQAAIKKGHVGVVNVLLDHGIRESNYQHFGYDSLLTVAITALPKQENKTTICNKVERQYVEIIRALIERGGWSINACRRRDIALPMCRAIELNHMQIFDLLVELGGCVASKLIISAVRSDNMVAMQRLLELDICIGEERDPAAALACAGNRNSDRCSSVLLDEGVDMYRLPAFRQPMLLALESKLLERDEEYFDSKSL